MTQKLATSQPAVHRSPPLGTVAMDRGRPTVHRSPPLGIVAVVFVLLFAASLAATLLMTGGAAFPNPYNLIEQSQNYFAQFPAAVRVTAFLQFGAAIPLGIFTAAYIGMLGITLVELPINTQTLDVSLDTPPSDWLATRARWEYFNRLRTLCELIGWGCLYLGSAVDSRDA